MECNNLQCVSEITIFDNEFFKLVTTQTNLYHQQYDKLYKKYDTVLKWIECN